jgi:hypothetical protein
MTSTLVEKYFDDTRYGLEGIMNAEQIREFFSNGKFACFGSRETPGEVLTIMRRLGKAITSLGGQVASGHALGADWAFESGAYGGNPAKMLVCLPWRKYNQSKVELYLHPEATVTVLTEQDDPTKEGYLKEAAKHHPAWNLCSPGAKLLHGRNILIGEGAKFGFCYLNPAKRGGGGSGQCWRYLGSLNVPVVDLSQPGMVKAWGKILDAIGF